MKIAAVSYRAPSRELSNDDVIHHLEAQNPEAPRVTRRLYLQVVDRLLKKTGARTRRWRDLDGGEKASDLILGAMDGALDQAGMTPSDVDLVIYCGVGKGFLEPANAYFYANARGMQTANCFDITDACMSWIRALQTSYLMLRAGQFRNAMIVNGEFHLGLHDSWQIDGMRSLEHTFPMYTIGEAATATIVTSSDNDWTFDYSSRPELADLCTIPLHGYTDFVEPTQRIGLNGVKRFVSFGTELMQEGSAMLAGLIEGCITDPQSKAWYFPHAPSKAVYEKLVRDCDLPANRTYLEVFPRFGNLVSASIPVGLATAEQEGLLRRGDEIALIPASAGMVASVVQMTF